MILCIETATNICSVALCDSTRTLSLRESSAEKSHASLLTTFIKEILDETDTPADHLDAVAVSMGPGSYTGLRIGVSVAKGIAYASKLPLVAVNTLESMYYGIRDNAAAEGISMFCPVIDARRMEVYSALFDREGKEVKETGAEIIDENSFAGILNNNTILFFGTGAAKCSETIKHPGARFINEFMVSASSLRIPAFKAFDSGNFVDTAYFEPYYLKDFIATIPRKSLLNG